MKDMKLLTEKDMEYFRKKEEEGSTVILELSEEQLLRLDFSRWMNREPYTIKEAEVMEWLQEKRIEIQKLYEGSQAVGVERKSGVRMSGTVQCKTLVEWMLNNELTDMQYEAVRQATNIGATEEQILKLLSSGITQILCWN